MPDGAASDFPSYADLPQIDELGMPHAWSAFGEGDELGTLNHLTRERVRAAAGLVRTGEVISLSLPLDEPSPPLSGRRAYRHDVHALDRNTFDDRLESFSLQGSSQWDGLLHVRAREFGFYGGRRDDPTPGAGALGIDRYAEHGIVGRGVLADLDRHARAEGRPIDALSGEPVGVGVLRDCLAAQGVELQPGDVLCLRFGWTAAYRALDADGRTRLASEGAAAGLAAGADMASFLWDAQVAAVAADNPAVEGAPGTPGEYLHRRLLPLLGFALGELFDLDTLADRCDEDRCYDFLFVAAPLRVPGGVGSPANALAIR